MERQDSPPDRHDLPPDRLDPVVSELEHLAGAVADAQDRLLRAVHEQLFTPLVGALRRVDFHAELDHEWAAHIGELGRLADAAPETVVRPEPPDLYRAAGGDSPWRAARKIGTRAERWLEGLTAGVVRSVGRLTGADDPPEDPRTQSVPWRMLVRYHLRVRAGQAFDPIRVRLRQVIVAAVADLEREITM